MENRAGPIIGQMLLDLEAIAIGCRLMLSRGHLDRLV